MAAPKGSKLAAIQKELSEVIGQMQVLEERQRIADGLEERLRLAELRISAILRQDVSVMNEHAQQVSARVN